MPVYQYRCKECNISWEAANTVANRYITCKCGKTADIIIYTSSKPVIYDYFSENLNAYITGPAQKSRIMKKKDMEEVG